MDSNKSQSQTRSLLVLLLIVVVGWKFVLPSFLEPIVAKEKQLAAAKKKISDLQDRVGDFVRCMESTQKFGKDCLPSDFAMAAVRYQDWIRQCCMKIGIENPKITVREPANVEGVGTKIRVSLVSQASTHAAGDLLDLMTVAPMSHRVVRVKMGEWDSPSQTVRLELEMEAFTLNDNPSYDPKLLARSVSLRGLGEYMGERNSFAKFVPKRSGPAVTEPEAEPQPLAVTLRPRVPTVDELNLIKFVGILERDGVARALFQDGNQQTEWVVELNGELRLSSFVAIIEKLEGDSVVLRQGRKQFSMSLGQTLRQGLRNDAEFQSVQ